MEKLIEITDKEIGMPVQEVLYWKVRDAARAIVFDFDKKKIGLLHITKQNYHTVSGGGVEQGESILEALNREILEELGCKIKVTKKLTTILEYRSHSLLKQRSHCFIADLLEKKEFNPTQEEIDSGAVIVWMPLEEAIKTMKKELIFAKENNNTIDEYERLFMLTRNIIILEMAKEELKK